jgi:integrase
LELQSYEQKAIEVIKKLPVFSWGHFDKMYLSNYGSAEDIKPFFDAVIDEKLEFGKVSTAYSYRNARDSFFSFRKKIKFIDIDQRFLKLYEKWMVDNGKSRTTAGVYLRNLRTVFNLAIKEKVIPNDYYPFGKGGYKIPRGRNIKKALSAENIKQLFDYKAPKKSRVREARDLWFFLYFGNGMNMKDLCLLKKENLNDKFITFTRAKTEHSVSESKPIQVPLNEHLKRIIKEWGTKKASKDDFLFPFMEKGVDKIREKVIHEQRRKLTNKYLKIIGVELGFDIVLTTSHARHSYATTMQRSGIPIAFISESLGHANIRTTSNYLAGFEDNAKIINAQKLTEFL